MSKLTSSAVVLATAILATTLSTGNVAQATGLGAAADNMRAQSESASPVTDVAWGDIAGTFIGRSSFTGGHSSLAARSRSITGASSTGAAGADAAPASS